MTSIQYEHSRFLWQNFTSLLLREIEAAPGKKICDIGGGAHPMLSCEDIAELQLDYTVLDISAQELEHLDPQYRTLVLDVSEQQMPLREEYDLVFSKMLAEHVPDGGQFHRNTYKMLKKGGIAVHFFPTLYNLPFVANKLIGEQYAKKLFDLIVPDKRKKQDKFPAFYSMCRGPSKKYVRAFENMGFTVKSYIGLFGHRDYYQKLKPIQKLHDLKTACLLKHPNPLFTSYAFLVLEK